MNLRALWTRVQHWYAGHSARDRRILLGVAIAAGLSLVFIGVVQPMRGYRAALAEEIAEGQEDLERSARFLAAADGLRAEQAQLAKRLEQAKTRLLPGDSGTLGAAALQERTTALATEKGITVQSTQVMKEEPSEPFHKVSIRLTLSGELKPFADFLSGLEYGPQALTIPFVEVSRRGAVAGQKGPRTLSATVEVGGYLMASTKAAKAESEPEPEPDAAAAPSEGETGTPPASEGVVASEVKPAPGAETPTTVPSSAPPSAAPAESPPIAGGPPTSLPVAASPAPSAAGPTPVPEAD